LKLICLYYQHHHNYLNEYVQEDLICFTTRASRSDQIWLIIVKFLLFTYLLSLGYCLTKA